MKRKAYVLAFALACAAATAYFYFGGDAAAPITNAGSAGTDVIAFGDSLVEGVGSTKGGGFVTLLSEDLGLPIVNLGRAGDTTADALARIDKVFEYKPKVVIVLLGGNDFLRKVPKETTFRNLDEIVRRIQERGSAVLLLAIQGGVLTDPFKDSFEDLARTRGTGLVPNVLSGLVGKRELMADSIHPNDRGYRFVADKVRPELERVLSAGRERR